LIDIFFLFAAIYYGAKQLLQERTFAPAWIY